MRAAPATAIWATLLATLAMNGEVWAEDAPSHARKLAMSGRCVEAVPLLEQEPDIAARPLEAVALGDCYLALVDLMKARDTFAAVAKRPVASTWTAEERAAVAHAAEQLVLLDARIPLVSFQLVEPVEGAVLSFGDHRMEGFGPFRIAPDETLRVSVAAPGHFPWELTLTLSEGQQRDILVRLKRMGEGATSGNVRPTEPPPPEESSFAVGARLVGFVIPKFVMQHWAEGTSTALVPGGAVDFIKQSSIVEYRFSLMAHHFGMDETAVRPAGAQLTEYEIVSSDLTTLIAAAQMFWRKPLSSEGRLTFKLGAGVGVGVTPFGDLHRTQAYPGKANGRVAWTKCQGPNSPDGTFRYCNVLDADKDHYGDYVEPSLFEGGLRPTVFPWIALPLLGLEARLGKRWTLGVEVGAAITGVMASAGGAFEL